jgi:hypothetical protein
MAGTKINNYSTIDNNIEELELTVDKCFNDRLTLTEMDTTTVPEIAAGSRVEVGGAFFKFDANEAISTTDPVTGTTVADGIVYVMLKPAVDGLSITAVFTATAPTWSDAKQGWYGVTTYAGYKYAPIVMEKINITYFYKKNYLPNYKNIQIDKINIITEITRNNTFFLGNSDDGTLLFSTIKTAPTSGNNIHSVAHGIFQAKTSNRILSATAVSQVNVGTGVAPIITYSAAVSNNVAGINWDDTNINVICSSDDATSRAASFIVFIIYKSL